MAKLGQLVLDGGRWGDESLVSSEWIAASTRAKSAGEKPGEDFGYLWWLGELPAEPRPLRYTMANGWGSQFIIVVPALDLVVVTTGGNDYNGKHMAVLPLVRELVRSVSARL